MKYLLILLCFLPFTAKAQHAYVLAAQSTDYQEALRGVVNYLLDAKNRRGSPHAPHKPTYNLKIFHEEYQKYNAFLFHDTQKDYYILALVNFSRHNSDGSYYTEEYPLHKEKNSFFVYTEPGNLSKSRIPHRMLKSLGGLAVSNFNYHHSPILTQIQLGRKNALTNKITVLTPTPVIGGANDNFGFYDFLHKMLIADPQAQTQLEKQGITLKSLDFLELNLVAIFPDNSVILKMGAAEHDVVGWGYNTTDIVVRVASFEEYEKAVQNIKGLDKGRLVYKKTEFLDSATVEKRLNFSLDSYETSNSHSIFAFKVLQSYSVDPKGPLGKSLLEFLMADLNVLKQIADFKIPGAWNSLDYIRPQSISLQADGSVKINTNLSFAVHGEDSWIHKSGIIITVPDINLYNRVLQMNIERDGNTHAAQAKGFILTEEFLRNHGFQIKPTLSCQSLFH